MLLVKFDSYRNISFIVNFAVKSFDRFNSDGSFHGLILFPIIFNWILMLAVSTA